MRLLTANQNDYFRYKKDIFRIKLRYAHFKHSNWLEIIDWPIKALQMNVV